MKFKRRDSIKPFDEKMWTWYRSKLQQIKVAQAKVEQKLLPPLRNWHQIMIGRRVSEEGTVSKTNLKVE
eukprot:186959-Ditylum_brightwellii.AAC.1